MMYIGVKKVPAELFDKLIPAIATGWAKVPLQPDGPALRVEEMTAVALGAARAVETELRDPAKRAAFKQKLKDGLGFLRKLTGQPLPN